MFETYALSVYYEYAVLIKVMSFEIFLVISFAFERKVHASECKLIGNMFRTM